MMNASRLTMDRFMETEANETCILAIFVGA